MKVRVLQINHNPIQKQTPLHLLFGACSEKGPNLQKLGAKKVQTKISARLLQQKPLISFTPVCWEMDNALSSVPAMSILNENANMKIFFFFHSNMIPHTSGDIRKFAFISDDTEQTEKLRKQY